MRDFPPRLSTVPKHLPYYSNATCYNLLPQGDIGNSTRLSLQGWVGGDSYHFVQYILPRNPIE
jgi:hypothetical protein